MVVALIGSPYERSFTFVAVAVLLLVSWPDRPALAVPVNWRLGRLGYQSPGASSATLDGMFDFRHPHHSPFIPDPGERAASTPLMPARLTSATQSS